MVVAFSFKKKPCFKSLEKREISLHFLSHEWKNKFFNDCKLEWQHQVEKNVHGNTIFAE